VWPRLRGQAGPAGDHEPESGSDTQLGLIGALADNDSQDPLHDLLQYIAEQALDCDMALVIDGVFLKALRTHKLIELLPEAAPTLQQFHCDLLPGNKSGPGADVAVTKVATLSKHAFETPRAGSGLNRLLVWGSVMIAIGLITDTSPHLIGLIYMLILVVAPVYLCLR
jgi:hypothetical protein